MGVGCTTGTLYFKDKYPIKLSTSCRTPSGICLNCAKTSCSVHKRNNFCKGNTFLLKKVEKYNTSTTFISFKSKKRPLTREKSPKCPFTKTFFPYFCPRTLSINNNIMRKLSLLPLFIACTGCTTLHAQDCI